MHECVPSDVILLADTFKKVRLVKPASELKREMSLHDKFNRSRPAHSPKLPKSLMPVATRSNQ